MSIPEKKFEKPDGTDFDVSDVDVSDEEVSDDDETDDDEDEDDTDDDETDVEVTDVEVTDVEVTDVEVTDVEVMDVHENGNRSKVKASSKARRGVAGGPAKQNGFGTDRLDAIRKVLQQKRSDLVDQQATQLNALYAPDKHHLADLEEMASDTTDTDSLCAIVDLGSSTIEQIDSAIERIGDGTYGICERCEEPIAPDRLEVLPFASLCVSCQRKKELGQGAEE